MVFLVVVIFWPGLVTGLLDKGPAVDLDSVSIELPAGNLGGLDQPGGLGQPSFGGAPAGQPVIGAPPPGQPPIGQPQIGAPD